MSARVIFLDRDGAINVDHGYVHKIEDWAFSEKAPEALRILQEAGYSLAVITNQSAIAEGKYTADDMHALHTHMKQQLASYGVTIDAIAFCPHGRNQNDCDCRKPKIGMAKQIERQLGAIDYQVSWTVGDKEVDVGFGKNAGTKTALIRSGYWRPAVLKQQPDMIVDSLFDFAGQL